VLSGVEALSERYVVWYERFVEMPTTSQDRWQVVGPEIHGPNVSAFPQALLMLEVGPDKRRRLNANAGRSSARYRDIGPIELGRTYAMKLCVRLSDRYAGLIHISPDGALVLDLPGATIDQAIAGSYWKEANYRNAVIDGPMSHDFSSLRIYDGDVSFGSGGTPPPPSAAPAPAPPPASNVIAQESFEGATPGKTGSPFTLVKGSGNRFSMVTAPKVTGAKAGKTTPGTKAGWFEQAGGGNQVAVGKTYTARREVTASISVFISKNTLADNRNRSVLRITSGDGATAGPRHEVGIHRTAQGTMHLAVWSVGKNGRYTYAKLGSAPKLGTWQTLKLETQWDRTAAATRLTIDGTEVLSPAAVNLSGIKANNFEVGLNYSHPSDKALLVLDNVALTDGAFSATTAGLGTGKTSKQVVGALSSGMVDLRAPGFVGRRNGVVSFRVPSRMRYTVSVLKGKTTVSRVTKTASAGLNQVGVPSPGTVGAYTVRLTLGSTSVSAPVRVSAKR
jgi:hypothetical protein